MQPTLRWNDPRSHEHRWMLAVALGAGLGALILGGAGRLAMRGITLWEGRPHQFSASGTLRVLGYGAAFGILGAGLRVSLDVAVERWRPVPTPRWAPAAAWALICLALAILVLTPLTAHRLILFPPVVVVYLLALEGCWRRWAGSRDRTAREGHGVEHGAAS